MRTKLHQDIQVLEKAADAAVCATEHTLRIGMSDATENSRKARPIETGAMPSCSATGVPLASSAKTAATKPNIASLPQRARTSARQALILLFIFVPQQWLSQSTRSLTVNAHVVLCIALAGSQSWPSICCGRGWVGQHAPAVDDLGRRAVEAHRVREAHGCAKAGQVISALAPGCLSPQRKGSSFYTCCCSVSSYLDHDCRVDMRH